MPGTEASDTEDIEATPRLKLVLANVGDAVAGTATVTDTLPAGIAVASTGKPVVVTPNGPKTVEEPCAVSGQTVTCEVNRPMSSGAQLVQVVIPLAVAPAADDTGQ